MNKTAIYARVSTDDKGQDTGLQTHELREYANRKGWNEITEYIDEGISGSKANRPSLDRLMNDCRGGKIQVVLVWRFNRFFRSLKHLVCTLDELDELGIKFVSLKDNIDIKTPAGRLQMQIIGAIDEFQRDLTRENVKAGLANAKRKGKRLGARPKLFNLDLARKLKREGKSYRDIAKEVGGVSYATIRRLLSC